MISPQDILQSKTLYDYVYVRVKSELNDFAGFITDETGKKVRLLLNPNWHPTKHANISGEVIAAPSAIHNSEARYAVYAGSPKPKQYRGHEWIEQYIQKTLPRRRKELLKSVKYNCAGWDGEEIVSIVGTKPLVQVGDVVYFHYGSLLNPENFMWREENGDLVYHIHYRLLFCLVRDSKITMLSGYVLVSEINDDKEIFDVGGVKVEGKQHGNFILVEKKEDVKGNKKAKYLTGVVEHIGISYKNDEKYFSLHAW